MASVRSRNVHKQYLVQRQESGRCSHHDGPREEIHDRSDWLDGHDLEGGEEDHDYLDATEMRCAKRARFQLIGMQEVEGVPASDLVNEDDDESADIKDNDGRQLRACEPR